MLSASIVNCRNARVFVKHGVWRWRRIFRRGYTRVLGPYPKLGFMNPLQRYGALTGRRSIHLACFILCKGIGLSSELEAVRLDLFYPENIDNLLSGIFRSPAKSAVWDSFFPCVHKSCSNYKIASVTPFQSVVVPSSRYRHYSIWSLPPQEFFSRGYLCPM